MTSLSGSDSDGSNEHSSPNNHESSNEPGPPNKHDPANERAWWRRKRLWLTLVFIVALYPTVVTFALWTGLVERALASEDLRVEIDNPSYSLIPGHIHLKKVRVYVNAMPQFVLFAEDVEARIRIIPLFQRKFSLSWLGAENVVYRMRLPLEEDQVDAPRTAAFPPLEGLPGENSISKEKAQEGEEGQPLWTVELNGLNVGLSELWFFEYRYVGKGKLRGGFERGPQVLDIDTSLEDLGPGKLYFGRDRVISHNLRGKLRARIPRLNPREHADLGFFDFVRFNVDLDADVETLEHVSAYVPGVAVSQGGGPFHADVEMQGGRLAASTVVTYATDELDLKANGFGLKTDWSVRIDMSESVKTRPSPEGAQSPQDKSKKSGRPSDEGPRIESNSQVTYVSFAAVDKRPFTIQLHRHVIRAALASPQIDENLDVARASIQLPRIVSTDLADMESVTGESFGSDGGEAEASLTLEMNEKKDFSGPFRASLEGLDLAIDPIKMSLNGQAETQVYLSLKDGAAAFQDVGVTLKDVTFHIGKKRIEDWWLKLDSERVGVSWAELPNLSADFSVSAKDAEPVLRGLAQGEKVPEIVGSLIKLRNVETKAELRKRGEVLDLMLENVNTSFIDFSGRIYQGPDEKRLALLVGGKVISLGIVQHGDQKRFRAFAHAGWLNDQLKDFPSPKESVEGQQP